MFQRIRSSKAAEAGFTLVEMVVVVAVIGILASVAVLAIGNTTEASKEAACEADLATVQTAADSYYAATGDYIAVRGSGDVADALEDADYLRRAPENGTYAIDSTNGNVTVTGCNA